MANENISTWQQNINSLLITIDSLESLIKFLKKQVLRLNAPDNINNLLTQAAQDMERAKNEIKYLLDKQEDLIQQQKNKAIDLKKEDK